MKCNLHLLVYHKLVVWVCRAPKPLATMKAHGLEKTRMVGMVAPKRSGLKRNKFI